MYFSFMRNGLMTKRVKTKLQKHRFAFCLLIFVSCCCCCCDGRLFGNIPPSRTGGGILFGAAGEEGENVRDRVHVQPGPGIGKQPPQNILGRLHTKDEDEEEKIDPRHPPKTARMRLGPILFDPEHLVSFPVKRFSFTDSITNSISFQLRGHPQLSIFMLRHNF